MRRTRRDRKLDAIHTVWTRIETLSPRISAERLQELDAQFERVTFERLEVQDLEELEQLFRLVISAAQTEAPHT